MVGRPTWRIRIGRKALQEVWEWSEGPPAGPGVVVSLTREVLQWSGGPPAGSGVVGRPSQRSGSHREFLREVRDWSGCYLGGPRVVGRPSGGL